MRIAFVATGFDNNGMKSILEFSLFLATVTIAAAPAQEPDNPAKVMRRIIAGLDADDFQTRVATARRMSEVSMTVLAAMSELPPNELSAEAAVRLLDELASRYTAVDREQDVVAASEILESFVTSDRLMLADGAKRILNRHWRQRVKLARKKLEKLGVKFRDGSFTSIDNMRWLPGGEMPSLQMFVGEDWQGTTEDLRVIDRMSALTDSRLKLTGLSVWVLEGHNLSEKDFSLLHEFVGQNRVYRRSRVALGIRGYPTFSPGVLIDAVTKGGSAEAAGLDRRDVLVSIVEPIPEELDPEEKEKRLAAQKLRDFEDLVERLKKYRVGDVVKLRVIRAITVKDQFGPRMIPGHPGAEQIVEVKLKGWHELPAEAP